MVHVRSFVFGRGPGKLEIALGPENKTGEDLDGSKPDVSRVTKFEKI